MTNKSITLTGQKTVLTQMWLVQSSQIAPVLASGSLFMSDVPETLYVILWSVEQFRVISRVTIQVRQILS